MEPQNKKLLYVLLIIFIVVIIVIAITLGIILGMNKKSTTLNNGEEEIDIINSYYNTEELMKKYPIEHQTRIFPGLEEKIQNRLLTGFENWNRGFNAWKAWGNILYTKDSIYNVHGARLSLAHYQQAMDITLKQANIIMGAFHNMLICDEFAAIYYDIITFYGDNQKKENVMEFVKFKDYWGELGTRVVEGWGSTKDKSYESMIKFQEEDKYEQQRQLDYILR